MIFWLIGHFVICRGLSHFSVAVDGVVVVSFKVG